MDTATTIGSPASGYGPRLSTAEYRRRVSECREALPAMLSAEQEMELRHRQLDLAIDHRLGCEFPQDRREALWAAQQRVQRQHISPLLYMLRKLVAKRVARKAQRLPEFVVAEYGKVLSQPELELFLGEQEAREPALPIDIDALRR